jgi:hypothetical protein
MQLHFPETQSLIEVLKPYWRFKHLNFILITSELDVWDTHNQSLIGFYKCHTSTIAKNSIINFLTKKLNFSGKKTDGFC